MIKVLVTGVAGQDGSNITRYLLNSIKNIKIYGTTRRLSIKKNLLSINDNRLEIIKLDINNQQSIINIVRELKPNFIVNFAAQSSVSESWNTPIQTFSTNTLSVLYFLESIRIYCPECRFYSAGSSEEYGDICYSPQDLIHPLKPTSPYGASKCATRHIVKVYRDSYNIYAIHSVLFNHEGIRRDTKFVTRKITSNIARIKKQFENKEKIIPFELGNIHTKRDWSDSEDFVEAIWLMLNMEKPDEYILSSDETHSIKEFIELSCDFAGLDYKWKNLNDKLKTELIVNNTTIMKISEKYFRPLDINFSCGNSKETRKKLNWKPKVNFKNLVKKMVLNDIQLLN